MKYTQIYCDICNDIIYNDHQYIMIKNKKYDYTEFNSIWPDTYPKNGKIKDLCEKCVKEILHCNTKEQTLETIKKLKRMAKYKNSHEAT